MTTFVTRILCGDLSISDIEIDSAPLPGENPTISFMLSTPYGTKQLTEEIFDGTIHIFAGGWVQRLQAGPNDHGVSPLIERVNVLLGPLLRRTRLSQALIANTAAALNMALVRQDIGPVYVWKLFKDEEQIFVASSLHVLSAEMDRILSKVH